jgi:hypothetical protein
MVPVARILTILPALAVLAACALDQPATVRAFVDRWAWAGAQTYFASSRRCTAAVYRLTNGTMRTGSLRVYDTRQGVAMLRRGRAVAFADPSHSTDAVSQGVMSADLHTGLGMLSSATVPRACMSDVVAAGVHRILTTPGVVTVYDPGENVLLLLDFATRHAVFLRRAP